jgi:hypothetical protein
MNKTITLIFLVLCLSSCAHYQDDNFLEEMVEDMLKEELYVDIDFTPKSKEV